MNCPLQEGNLPSDHLEMPKGILDCLFLLRRASRHWSLTRADVIVLPLPDAKLLLHLSNIGGMDFKSIFLPDISLYIVICSCPRLEPKLLDVKVNADMTVDSLPT